MGFVGFSFTFSILWWIVFLAVLPFKISTPSVIEKGHDSGAPEHPYLKFKIGIATMITFALTSILALLINYEVISWLTITSG